MKIVIPGGSGQVGTILARDLASRGDEVVILSRGASGPTPWRVVRWDARTVGPWAAELDGADAVINLAGRSVDCRYTPANRRQILQSRVDSTRVVGEAIARAARPPAAWLQMSTATIYAHRYDAPNDEATGILGGAEPGVPDTWRFSIEVATAWERALAESETPPATRKVAMRAAMVMSPDRGGVFDTLLGLVRRGLGGRAGDGRQFVSWIHDDDFTAAVRWLLDRADVSGAVNVASPGPRPNDDFMRALREAWGRRSGCPPPSGCSRSARSACARRRSSSSRAAASCPDGCSRRASPSDIPAGRRRRGSCVGGGGKGGGEGAGSGDCAGHRDRSLLAGVGCEGSVASGA